jgi:predicted flap endonuclease-1-like 5' DNA nuclease
MNIKKIEGIGPKYANTLAKSGVKTTTRLLKDGASKKGRQMLAQKTGISEKLILEWVNLADLMRVKGVGEEYSDLLEEAGVDSVKELRNRKADNLHKAMVDTNAKKKLVRRPPSMKEVTNWVKQAQKLPPVVTH